MKKQIAVLTAAILFLLSSCTDIKSEDEISHESPLTSSVAIEILSSQESENEQKSVEDDGNYQNESSTESEDMSQSSSAKPSSQTESSSQAETAAVKNGAEAVSGGKYDTYILVNPTHYIPDDYELDLVQVQGKYNMQSVAAGHAKELLEDAKSAGYNMQLCSAYRTVATSQRLYTNKVNAYLSYGYSEADAKIEAAKWVAPPGTSEHHTGLAMDLVSSDYWDYYSDLEHEYENFDSFKWMYSHCAEYGFILRYPKDKQDITGITYEPWHYRYVGVEAATYIMQNGLCLEEFLGEA